MMAGAGVGVGVGEGVGDGVDGEGVALSVAVSPDASTASMAVDTAGSVELHAGRNKKSNASSRHVRIQGECLDLW